ncbi:acetylxylan esterase [uncultured Robinsoniella sp.]|uniref:acetylxylan esterase n=1 Tax=uncultured Robinsoniella sp. TaxID=904190 RepID=UPI00374E2CAF
MPMLDMPLEDLKTYKGSTPRPEDFDSYWMRAIEEMKETNPNPQFTESDFKVPYAKCYDLFFTGVKGARIHAKVLIPNKAREDMPGPAVLTFHGYTGNAGDWMTKLPYVGAGFVVAALDCRGQGGMSEDVGGIRGNTMHGHIIRGVDGDSDNMLMRNIFLDTASLAGIIMDMPMVDENRVGTCGVSQGGGLSLACAALEPRIARAAVQYPFLSDYKRVWDMDLAKDAYEELQTYFRFFDPLHEREEEFFKKLGYVDIQNHVPQIKGKVQMAITLMDNICPPSTQYAAYNKICSEKEVYVFPDFGHDILPGQDDRMFRFLMDL